jgi:transcriptional regulator with XRE-family HTH domain
VVKVLNIGEYIKKIREEKELSINQLALYSNVSAAHISRIERGLREPSPEILKKISEALKVPYEELMKIAGYLESDTPNPADKNTSTPWWEKDEPPTDIELEEFIKNNSNIKLMGNPLDEKAKDDVIMFLRAAHEFIKQKREVEEKDKK